MNSNSKNSNNSINVNHSVHNKHNNTIIIIGATYCTPEINTSEIIVDFERCVSIISQLLPTHNVICLLYVAKDCQLSIYIYIYMCI